MRSGYQPLDEKWMHVKMSCAEMHQINSLLKHNSWEGMIKSDQRFRSTSHASHVNLNFSPEPNPIYVSVYLYVVHLTMRSVLKHGRKFDQLHLNKEAY